MAIRVLNTGGSVKQIVNGGVWMSLDRSVDCELLEHAIRNALDEKVQEIKVRVKVEGNKVYLYGSACSLEQRANLERLALSVPGVAEVENYVCVNLFA